MLRTVGLCCRLPACLRRQLVLLQEQSLALGAHYTNLVVRLEETSAAAITLDQEVSRLTILKNARDEQTRTTRSEGAWLQDVVCTVQARPCTATFLYRLC